MVQVHLCIHATINQSININSPVFTKALWRNGSASDSRSEGCVFKSRRGHLLCPLTWYPYSLPERILGVNKQNIDL